MSAARTPAGDAGLWRRHRLLNGLQSTLLVASMAAILGSLGWVLAGPTGAVWALATGLVLVAFNPGMSPWITLRMYGARPLDRHQAPDLVQLVRELAHRAGLPVAPVLYYVPSRMLNAFAVGSRHASAVAVTDGLLRSMSPRELVGVLAHEISHVRHNDMWVMGLADLLSRLTSVLSTVGQLLLLLNLPLLLFSGYTISWVAIAILIFAPALTALMQLALSRAREYDADLGAAELTGDPRGLAAALAKLERHQGRFFEQILLPGRRLPDPSLLRTHPPTEERVQRLLELEATLPRRPQPEPPRAVQPNVVPVIRRAPRRRVSGVWY